MKITMFKELNPKAKAIVVETVDTRPKAKCYNLISYKDSVAFIKLQQSNGKLSVYVTDKWCVSSTTAKHVYMFFEEYFDKVRCGFAAPTNRREMQELLDTGKITLLKSHLGEKL